MLQLSNIYKKIDGLPVLNNISIDLANGMRVAIAGETGSGKTTLLKAIAGLEAVSSGLALFNGEKILGPHEKLIAGHEGIAYLSQHFELRNNYRVAEELDYTNEMTLAEAQAIFKICQIDHLMKRWTTELSGGEKQRIVTARALISKPKLLLLDEPFSNLDIPHKALMKAVIDRIISDLHITCIITSHDPKDILPWADEIVIMKSGGVVQQGTARQIYYNPVARIPRACLEASTW